mgnify:CR=1 FL=1
MWNGYTLFLIYLHVETFHSVPQITLMDLLVKLFYNQVPTCSKLYLFMTW